MILNVTRSYILLQVDEKVVKIEGEIAGPGTERGPYFVAYANSICKWANSPQEADIDHDQRQQILKRLKEDAKERNLAIEIE